MALLAVVGAITFAVRWALRPRDELGRARPFPRYAVTGLVVLAVAAAIPVIRHNRLEQRLSSVASALVGHSVRVHCQSAGQAFVDAGAELGAVRYDQAGRPEPTTLIKLEQCGYLRSYASHHGRRPTPAEVVAVHVLTHESMHMRGLTIEAEAECAAVQRDASTARLLGANPADAAALALAYWRSDYANLPDDYRTSECAPGARLDDKLATAPW